MPKRGFDPCGMSSVTSDVAVLDRGSLPMCLLGACMRLPDSFARDRQGGDPEQAEGLKCQSSETRLIRLTF